MMKLLLPRQRVATTGERRAIASARRGASPNRLSDPISLVAAEIHLGSWPTGICAGWLTDDIQILCHAADSEIIHKIKE
jgi:hypothetical protein